MEIFDGAHILQVSLSVGAVEDLDHDEDALGITSKNLVGHIVAVAGLTLVPDLYSSPLGVIAIVTKVTPFFDKLQRPLSRPPLVETNPEVHKILSARLGQCFSTCVATSFQLSGSGGATGAAKICHRPLGAPPQGLLRNVTDFSVSVARRLEPSDASNSRKDLVARETLPPVSTALNGKKKHAASVNVVLKPLPPLLNANFASGAAAAGPPPLIPWGRAKFSSAPLSTSNPGNVRTPGERSEVLQAKSLGTPSSGSRHVDGTEEKLCKSQKSVAERSSHLSSSSDRSALRMISMQEMEDDGGESSDAGAKDGLFAEKAATTNHSVEKAIVTPEDSGIDQQKPSVEASLSRNGTVKALDVAPQLTATQLHTKQTRSTIEAAVAVSSGVNVPSVPTVSVEVHVKGIDHEERKVAAPEAESPQGASVATREVHHRVQDEDGESTLSIPHDDLMQVERDNEETQNLHLKKIPSPRRVRSGMSAARSAARTAALALARVRTPVHSTAASNEKNVLSELAMFGAGAASTVNVGIPVMQSLLAEVPAGPSRTAASTLPFENRKNMSDADGDSDSLDDEGDGTYGSSHLPETQGNLEFAMGTAHLHPRPVEVPKDAEFTGPEETKAADSNFPVSPSGEGPNSRYVEGQRKGEDTAKKTASVRESPATDSLFQSPRRLRSVNEHKQSVIESGMNGGSLGRKQLVSTDNYSKEICKSTSVPVRAMPAITQKNRDEKGLCKSGLLHQGGGEASIPQGHSENLLLKPPSDLCRLVSDPLALDSKVQANESASFMYEEAAEMMSRLRSLDRVQTSNPWHACLAPNSVANNRADQSRNVDLLKQSVHKRRRSTGSVVPGRGAEYSNVVHKRLKDPGLSMPTTVFDSTLVQEGHAKTTVLLPRTTSWDEGADEPPLKRHRKNAHPKKAIDPLLQVVGEVDMVFLEGSASCSDRCLAKTTAIGNVENEASDAARRQGAGGTNPVHAASTSLNEAAVLNPVPVTRAVLGTEMHVDSTEKDLVLGEERHRESRSALDRRAASVTAMHWNAVKTDWAQSDFIGKTTIRHESHLGDPRSHLPATDLEKLTPCVNAVVAVFSKDLGS